jgi:predicted nucleic acid-binding protein
VRELHDVLLLPMSIVWVDDELHRAGLAALLAGGSPSISLVDWISFELMRRHGISTAFAFDADFAAQGFSLIP